MRAALLVLLLTSPAFAEDCAKYEAPLAYNACLARQGPGARAVRVGAAPAARAAAPRVRRGRSEMVFTPER